MFGIFLSALNASLGFVFRTVVVKFVVFFGLFLAISLLVGYLGQYLPKPADLNSSLGSIGADAWYFLELFKFSTGASMIVSAIAFRFLIRRMPLIG